jgi:hypothetical protein
MNQMILSILFATAMVAFLLGVDYIVAHLGYDERRHVPALSALDNLQ